MLRKLLIPLVIALALGGLFFFGLLRGSPDRDVPSNLLGKVAPGFDLPLHVRYQPDYGPTLSSADLIGRPLVVNFWASWCGPCYVEAPVLQTFWEEYQDSGVLFIGIQTQDRGNEADGRKFLSQFGLTFPNGADDDSTISVNWGLMGVPETFFVDKAGNITYKHIGPVTEQVLSQQLATLLQ